MEVHLHVGQVVGVGEDGWGEKGSGGVANRERQGRSPSTQSCAARVAVKIVNLVVRTATSTESGAVKARVVPSDSASPLLKCVVQARQMGEAKEVTLRVAKSAAFSETPSPRGPAGCSQAQANLGRALAIVRGLGQVPGRSQSPHPEGVIARPPAAILPHTVRGSTSQANSQVRATIPPRPAAARRVPSHQLQGRPWLERRVELPVGAQGLGNGGPHTG